VVKPRGILRTGAVVPSLIFVVLVGVFFTFFFDGVIRRGMEYALTHINGAEVDIGRVATSFLHARLEIDNIQVTDKEHPERNSAQVGNVRFQMSWDALLRAKIKVDEAEILNIQVFSPRKSPGYVIPPPPPEVAKHGPSALDKVQAEVAEQTQKDYNGNFLGDIAGVLGGKDPSSQLNDIQGQLKSDARIKELQKDLNDKKAKWDQRLKTLPQGKEMQTYVDRMKALKFDFNNPSELAKSVQEGQKIIKEAGDKVKVIDEAQKDLKNDMNTYSQAYKDLDKLVQEDVNDLQNRLKLPNIDAKNFSQQLFMHMIEKKLGSMAKYVELARQYAPAKKKGDGEKKATKSAQVAPPKRGTGTSYHFPVTTGYPLFWLKHAEISSNMNSDEFSGNIKGEIRDLTSDPEFLGRPTLITLQGDFPKQDIHGVDAKITLDHTTEVAKDTMVINVEHFPTGQNVLSDSDDVKLALTQAIGRSHTEAAFIDDQITMETKNVFGDIKYDLQAKNSTVKEIIDNVLKGIPNVDVNAEIKGSLSNLDIHVNSNLGDELSKGFQKQLQAKIDEAKGKLKGLIDSKIGGDKTQLKSQMDNGLGSESKDLDKSKSDADKAMKTTQGQMSKGSGGKSLEQQGKDLMKGLGL